MKQFSLRKILLIFALLGVVVTTAQPTSSVNIIPQPVQLVQNEGEFQLPEKLTIAYDAALKAQAEYLQEVLAQSTGRIAVMKEGKKKGDIVLLVDAHAHKVEGYALSVTPKNVKIVASDPSGAFYGIQSLLQLFPRRNL